MAKLIKIFLIMIVLGLGVTLTVLAQETPPEITEAVNLEEDVKAEDLEIGEPSILPDSPFYFLKNLGRNVREFFAFNPITKAQLKERFANEKLIELKKMVEAGKTPEAIKQATENYQQEIEAIKQTVEKIKEKAKENPQIEKFLDKFTKHQVLHQKLLQKLENQVPPEAFEKIQEAREKHLERFGEVMTKLEDRAEKIIEKLKEKPEIQEKIMQIRERL